MTQEQWIVLLLKVFCITGFSSLTGWVIQYSRYTAAWRNPIGRTLMAKSLIIATLLVPTTLSLFFHLNRGDSLIVAWIDTALIGMITPVMAWRMIVWRKVRKEGSEPEGSRS